VGFWGTVVKIMGIGILLKKKDVDISGLIENWGHQGMEMGN